MPEPLIPPVLGQILQRDRDPDAVFAELLPQLGDLLQCDRCFLYVRDPQTRLGRVPYCWRRSEEYPDVHDAHWKPEPETLEKEDPMFAAALHTQPSIYVEDVETASPETLNQNFEREQFGHRALIHSHLSEADQLWGILQPCMFDHPRDWTEFDHAIMNYVERSLTPFVQEYVKTHCPDG